MIPQLLENWLLDQHVLEDPVEQSMRIRGEEARFPIIGPLVGRFYETQLRMIGAKRVYEMGSGFGYSTLWAAQAVGEDGRVVHTDGDPALSSEARRWLTQAGVGERVRFRTGDAIKMIDEEEGPFDAIFIDVDKEQYPAAWQAAVRKLRMGGIIITDNVLWSGKVADASDTSEATRGVRDYVATAFQDRRFTTTIVPLRDGVAVSMRRS